MKKYPMHTHCTRSMCETGVTSHFIIAVSTSTQVHYLHCSNWETINYHNYPTTWWQMSTWQTGSQTTKNLDQNLNQMLQTHTKKFWTESSNNAFGILVQWLQVCTLKTMLLTTGSLSCNNCIYECKKWAWILSRYNICL